MLLASWNDLVAVKLDAPHHPLMRKGAGAVLEIEARRPELDLGTLTPAERLWVVALTIEENGGPADYVLSLRDLAERLEALGWWLLEPSTTDPECP